MSSELDNKRNKTVYMIIKRVGLITSAFLLCVALLAGCSRKETGTGEAPTQAIATATPRPTATPLPTPTPLPFVKQAYETYVRDDVYRIPVRGLAENHEILSSEFAGEYMLLWYTEWGPAEDDPARDLIVLASPGVSTDQHLLDPGFSYGQTKLLTDGTVVIYEWGNNTVHVYDNTLTELRAFSPDENGALKYLGVGDDGTIWIDDEENSKLCGVDLNGQPSGEYAYDGTFEGMTYIGSRSGRECFMGYTGDGSSDCSYLYLSVESKDIVYRGQTNRDLGDEWASSFSAPMQGWNILFSDSTWFFHEPGYCREGFAFPKSSEQEGIGFIQENIVCGCISRWTDDVGFKYEYRLYDLKNRTVSDSLRESDIPDCAYLSAKGMVGDGNVVLTATNENGEKELILWTTGEKTSPIEGFFDFSKDDPEKYLADQITELKEKYGVVITPDKAENEGKSANIGDHMLEMEFINTFRICAESDPEVLKTAGAGTVHPENMRNNDGAHYTFNPHVFSGFYLKEHGEKRRDVFFSYVDAVRTGEDRFRCPDPEDAAWCSGRLATYFFPIGAEYTHADYSGDGWAGITYMIPKEEFLEKERDFEEKICAIVNDAVEEDYTDLEKAIALYEFMTEYCVYDYEMLDHLTEWADRQSGYRCLMEKQGICWEIACLYRYLLLQCGVDAEESTGSPLEYGEDSHAWNYIELDGRGYLIDATWGLTEDRMPDLKYFLFTDELRKTRDGFDPESFDIAGYGMYGARDVYSFEANDEKYSKLWDGRYIAFDQENKCIFYKDLSNRLHRFEYGDQQDE